MAFVLFGLLVVADAHEQQVVGILRHLFGIVLPLNLRNRRVGILVIFQFDDDGGRDVNSGGSDSQTSPLGRVKLMVSEDPCEPFG